MSFGGKYGPSNWIKNGGLIDPTLAYNRIKDQDSGDDNTVMLSVLQAQASRQAYEAKNPGTNFVQPRKKGAIGAMTNTVGLLT